MEAPITAVVLRRIPLSRAQSGVHKSWRARVRSQGVDYEAHVKLLPRRELIIECACAMIGRALALPIPRPILAADAELGVLFGSESVEHPDLRMPVQQVDSLNGHLQKWRALPLACVFDEWMANPDRNRGNILTDGAGAFWLIDHEHAIPPGLSPGSRTENQLLRVACALFADDLATRRLLSHLGACARLASTELPDQAAVVADWITSDVLDFLRQRHPNLWTLLREGVTGNHELPGV